VTGHLPGGVDVLGEGPRFTHGIEGAVRHLLHQSDDPLGEVTHIDDRRREVRCVGDEDALPRVRGLREPQTPVAGATAGIPRPTDQSGAHDH